VSEYRRVLVPPTGTIESKPPRWGNRAVSKIVRSPAHPKREETERV
jgi:hypothetical protein